MLNPNPKIHPFFARIQEREKILHSVQPSQLIVEAENNQQIKHFVELFDQPSDIQFEQFVVGSSFSSTLTLLLKQRSTPEHIQFLLAFLDKLFDMDYNRTIKALLPVQAELTEALGAILVNQVSTSSHSNINYPFLVRTALVVMASIITETKVVLEKPIKDEHDHKKERKKKEEEGKRIDIVLRGISTYLDKVQILVKEFSKATLTLESLKRFLRDEYCRKEFLDKIGLASLKTILADAQKQTHTDALYHTLFILWSLTFTSKGAYELSQNEFVGCIANLMSKIQPEREELVRMIVAIIKQLVESHLFIESAYDNDILRLLRMFQNKKYVDQDLTKDISDVCEQLYQELRHLSLWDKYVREVRSGKLRNTLSHKSDLFWKNNVERFGENQFAVLFDLMNMLKNGDEETIAVACHDLGEYAARNLIGRIKLEEIGAKAEVMKLMGHTNAMIQREALRTTQLLLLRSQT